MPHLNWRNAQIQQVVYHQQGPNGEELPREFQLELTISPAQLAEFHAKLTETFIDGAGELRVDLPNQWITFWKVRDGESRLLIAHPQQDEWVSTAALEGAHGQLLVQALQGAGAPASITVGQYGTIGAVSNVEIIIRVQ